VAHQGAGQWCAPDRHGGHVAHHTQATEDGGGSVAVMTREELHRLVDALPEDALD
jgi:hypothetical protein